MFRATLTALFCWAFLLVQSYGQDVFVPRELKAVAVSPADKEGTQPAKKERSSNDSIPPKHPATDDAATLAARAEPVTLHSQKVTPAKTNIAKTASAKEAESKEPATNLHPDKTKTEKRASANPPVNETAANSRSDKPPRKMESVQGASTAESTVKSNLDKSGRGKTEPAQAAALKPPVVNHAPDVEKVRATRTESVELPATKTRAEEVSPEKIRTAKTESGTAKGFTERVAEDVEGGLAAKPEQRKPKAVKAPPLANPHADKAQTKIEPDDLPGAKEQPATGRSGKPQSAKAEPEVTAGHAKKKQSENSEIVKSSAGVEATDNSDPTKAQATKFDPVKVLPEKEPADPHSDRSKPTNNDAMKAPSTQNSRPEKGRSAKADAFKSSVAKELKPNPQSEKAESAKAELAKASLVNVSQAGANPRPDKVESNKADSRNTLAASEAIVSLQLSDRSIETASTKLADGFDFPVGKPEGEGYYKARGFRSGGHVGEDWDGIRGGDTDLGDPIYCIGNGIVVFARDVHRGWGNVVIVRHAFREGGSIKHIDSLYGHLNSILVRRGQRVARGHQIGTMGTAHGQYDAHLHLEIRKNLEIGMSRAKFEKTLSNYYDPSQFIESHRHLPGGGASFRVAMNTFTHDGAYHFDDGPNYSSRKRSTTQSAAALKQALSSGAH